MRLIYAILFVCLLSSCGLFKSVNKEKHLTSVKTALITNKDSTGVTIDKSKTVIQETVDTTVTIPTKEVKQETVINKDSLINGMTAMQNDLISVRLVLDPLTGVLTTLATIKERLIPVKLNKTTTTENDITKRSDVKRSSKSKNETKQVDSVKRKEPAKMGIWLVGFIVVALALGAMWLKPWKK